MKHKYTRAEREQAADLCAIAASSGHSWTSTWDAMDHTGAPQSVGVLADAAWDASPNRVGDSLALDMSVRYAEAEAKLRCGWTP